MLKNGLQQKSRYKNGSPRNRRESTMSRRGSSRSVKGVHFMDATPKNSKPTPMKNKSKFLKFKEEENSNTFKQLE